MLIKEDAVDWGPVPDDILVDLRAVTNTIDWSKSDFDRNDGTGLPTRVVRVPYGIRKDPHQDRTDDVVRVLEAFEPANQWMKNTYPDYTFIKCEINWLFPGDMLPYHRDPNWWHEHSHRIHIPVTTNPDCFWLVEGRETHLDVGRHYEINNRRFHAMINRGTTPRLHLVFDLLENDRYQQALAQNIDINKITCIHVSYSTTEECLDNCFKLPDYLQDYQP